MNTQDREYALEPTTFHSMREAQELADTLEQNLNDRSMGAANVRPELVEMFSELVNKRRRARHDGGRRRCPRPVHAPPEEPCLRRRHS